MQLLRGILKLLAVSLTITAVLLPVAVVVHEGTHYLLYSLEGISVTSFHVLDAESMKNGRYGFVTTTKESRFGTVFHEGVANILTYLFVTSALLFFLLVLLKPFTIHQLQSMGLKRNSYQFYSSQEHNTRTEH